MITRSCCLSFLANSSRTKPDFISYSDTSSPNLSLLKCPSLMNGCVFCQVRVLGVSNWSYRRRSTTSLTRPRSFALSYFPQMASNSMTMSSRKGSGGMTTSLMAELILAFVFVACIVYCLPHPRCVCSVISSK